jgi:type I restriction enzyme S subunit
MRNGWQIKSIEEIADVFEDGDWIESKDQSDSGIRLVQTGNVGNGNFKNREEKARYISTDTFKKLRCTEIFSGDCLVSRLPDPVGRTCVIPEISERMITAVDCTIIRFKGSIVLSDWFVYYSLSKDYAIQIEKQITGATRQRISRKNLGLIEIPIPPLSEQKRIVAILDEAFAAIDKAKANTEKNLQNAEELFESYLQNVFANPEEDWKEKVLKEVTTKIGSGATPRGGNESYKVEGISLIRSMNVHDFEFRERNLAFIDEQQAKELNNVTLQENDVLLNITGASVARCCVIPKEYLPARVNQHVSIIRAKSDIIDPIFLSLLLTSKFYKDQLLFTGEQGATRQAITKAQLEVFKIAFPKSKKEQQNIVSKLDTLSIETKKLETIYQQKLDHLEELKKSILQKTFNGELTAKSILEV